MTRAIYIIGGAGVGKSTFTQALSDRLGWTYGPLEELHTRKNAKAYVTLRGHEVTGPETPRGMYLGVRRDEFPGSDGLDRVTSPSGEEWLQKYTLPPFIVSEGATLATRRFLYALHENTELRILDLQCDDMIHDLRLAKRGAGQEPSFVLGTVTKTASLVKDLRKKGADVRTVWTHDPEDWGNALEDAANYLIGA